MDDLEKRSVGNYFVFRMAMRALGTLLGGLLTKKISISGVYAIYSIFPVAVIIWSVFFFREIKVSVITSLIIPNLI